MCNSCSGGGRGDTNLCVTVVVVVGVIQICNSCGGGWGDTNL